MALHSVIPETSGDNSYSKGVSIFHKLFEMGIQHKKKLLISNPKCTEKQFNTHHGLYTIIFVYHTLALRYPCYNCSWGILLLEPLSFLEHGQLEKAQNLDKLLNTDVFHWFSQWLLFEFLVDPAHSASWKPLNLSSGAAQSGMFWILRREILVNALVWGVFTDTHL